MPYPVKQPANLALQIIEFIVILALVYGVFFIVFPAIFDIVTDASLIMVNSQLKYL